MGAMDTILAVLPQQEGLLPKWVLFVSVVAILNSVQSYSTMHFTQRIYSGPTLEKTTSKTVPTSSSSATAYPDSLSASPATPLQARTFGTWTLLTSIVRLYCAYNLDQSSFYHLAIWTYAVAFGHFMSEWFYFRTVRWGAPLAGPVIVSTGSLIWMASQYAFYVKS